MLLPEGKCVNVATIYLSTCVVCSNRACLLHMQRSRWDWLRMPPVQCTWHYRCCLHMCCANASVLRLIHNQCTSSADVRMESLCLKANKTISH